MHLTGKILAAHGRHYLVEPLPANGAPLLLAVTRGKKSDVTVGDEVELLRTSSNQAVIERILPRRTLLYRSDQYREKMLAANLDQLFVVIATEPSFSDDLVSRALVAAESSGIQAHLILNKIDVLSSLAAARTRLAVYAQLGYPVHEISVQDAPDQVHALLTPLFSGKNSILIGQSGMGKSSLINVLVPHAAIATREFSAALDTGKHTTTFTRAYALPQGGTIVDSPGFQEFGLYHLSEGQLERAFPEMSAALGGCRFYNCHHISEPGCSVRQAVEAGHIAAQRYALYLQLLHESSQKPGR